MEEPLRREAAYDTFWYSPGMAGATARCVGCHTSLGDVVVLWTGGLGVFLAPGYVSIGERRGLSAFGHRSRRRIDRGVAALRRGEWLPGPGGKRIRSFVGNSKPPASSEPVAVYCPNCGMLQRVGRPPFRVAPDPAVDTSVTEEVSMADA